MRKLKITLLVVLLATAFSAHDNGSFQLPIGNHIKEGKSKQKVIYLAGVPKPPPGSFRQSK